MVNTNVANQLVVEGRDKLCIPVATTFALENGSDLDSLTKRLSEACSHAEKASVGAAVLLDLSCAGTTWPDEASIAQVTRWEREVRRLERLPYMIIAGVEGLCTGPALDLLLAADLRVASPTTTLQMTINHHETWPGMCLYRLVLELGLAHARKLAVRGESMPIERALVLGLIDEIASDPLAKAKELADDLRGRRGKEISIRRELAFEAATSAYDDALGAHLAACSRELRRLATNGKVE